MISDRLQQLCALGQSQLSQTLYWEAEQTLIEADALATSVHDFDTLSRLYMPLQEARRQRRQRCGEGAVRLDILAASDAEQLDPTQLIGRHPQGQFLIAGWCSVAPAVEFRRLAAERKLYADTFLAAVYPTTEGPMVAVIPFEDSAVPAAMNRTPDELARALPEHSLLIRPAELSLNIPAGDAQSFSKVMSLWERLHTPFLKAAIAEPSPLARIELFRRTIRVDYACELAHQYLSRTASQEKLTSTRC